MLPEGIREWLSQSAANKSTVSFKTIELDRADAPMKFELSVISQIGPDEILLRLIKAGPADDKNIIRNKLQLTQREAEVLLWIARGKSNRDIAEILSLSPRTVNKHLEQIFNKIGVENRASAAALTVRILNERQ